MVAWIILNISDATKNIIAIISNAPGITDGSLRLNWLFIVAIIISVQPIIFIIIDTNSNILISCAPGYYVLLIKLSLVEMTIVVV